MPYCSNCGNELKNGAKFCPECGTAVSRKRQTRKSQSRIAPLADSPREQSTEDAVRRGMTNAKFNDEMSDVLGIEISIVSVAIGFAMKSWWWGGGTFLALIFMALIPSIGTIMCYIFGIAWGVIGYYVGSYLFGDSAGWVIGIIAGLSGIGTNLAGRQYFEDIGT